MLPRNFPTCIGLQARLRQEFVMFWFEFNFCTEQAYCFSLLFVWILFKLSLLSNDIVLIDLNNVFPILFCSKTENPEETMNKENVKKAQQPNKTQPQPPQLSEEEKKRKAAEKAARKAEFVSFPSLFLDLVR